MAFGRGRLFGRKFESSSSEDTGENPWASLEKEPTVEENERETNEEELDYSDIGEVPTEVVQEKLDSMRAEYGSSVDPAENPDAATKIEILENLLLERQIEKARANNEYAEVPTEELRGQLRDLREQYTRMNIPMSISQQMGRVERELFRRDKQAELDASDDPNAVLERIDPSARSVVAEQLLNAGADAKKVFRAMRGSRPDLIVRYINELTEGGVSIDAIVDSVKRYRDLVYDNYQTLLNHGASEESLRA